MHIQFKGLLMGWYHVNRIGKGICLGNVDEVHYNEDFIAKHTPTKDEALELKQRDIRDDELEGYETWPLYKKWMAITQDVWSFHREVNNTGCCADESSQIYSDALHYIFEKCYGYPLNSFFSTHDYDGNAMIFCDVLWPPKEYHEALAAMTEEKLQAQLREFLVEVTGDSKYASFPLRVCEEYIKE